MLNTPHDVTLMAFQNGNDTQPLRHHQLESVKIMDHILTKPRLPLLLSMKRSKERRTRAELCIGIISCLKA